MTEVYEEIVPNGNCKYFVDHIFRIFDQDGNGYLDFKVIQLKLCSEAQLSRML